MLSRLRHPNPYLLLTLAALFWSGNMVVGRAVHDSVPPISLAFWRWMVAFALTLPLALPHLRSQWPILRRKWRMLLLLGFLSVSCFNTFAYIGLQYTTATNAALLNSFIPIAIVAISWVFLGKRLRGIEALGIATSFAGVLVIVSRGELAVLLDLGLNVGDLWLMLAVLSWAIYTVCLQWRPAGLDPVLMLATLILIGIVTLIPLYAWELAAGRTIRISLPALAGIAYTGIFAAFLSYICYNRGVAEVGPAKAGLFIHLMPVFGTLLAAMFLGETPRGYHLVGIALIFTGIYLTTHTKPFKLFFRESS